jgi:hypothetical protein
MEKKMQRTALAMLFASSLAFAAIGSVALADETSTTTTTRSDAPAPGIAVGVPGVVGVQIGGDARPDGCATRKTTHTNDATGNSVTRQQTNCN